MTCELHIYLFSLFTFNFFPKTKILFLRCLESSPEWKLASAKILARIGDYEIRWYTPAEFLQHPGAGNTVYGRPKPSGVRWQTNN
jgi:hypothetical protein